MLPEEEELPPTDLFYDEVECAKHHGGWLAWEQLPAFRREQLLAHEIHKSRREAYYRERVSHHTQRKAKGKDTSPAFDPLEAIKRGMGVKY